MRLEVDVISDSNGDTSISTGSPPSQAIAIAMIEPKSVINNRCARRSLNPRICSFKASLLVLNNSLGILKPRWSEVYMGSTFFLHENSQKYTGSKTRRSKLGSAFYLGSPLVQTARQVMNRSPQQMRKDAILPRH